MNPPETRCARCGQPIIEGQSSVKLTDRFDISIWVHAEGSGPYVPAFVPPTPTVSEKGGT